MHLLVWAFITFGTGASAEGPTCSADCKAKATECKAECRELKGDARRDCVAFCTAELAQCSDHCGP